MYYINSGWSLGKKAINYLAPPPDTHAAAFSEQAQLDLPPTTTITFGEPNLQESLFEDYTDAAGIPLLEFSRQLSSLNISAFQNSAQTLLKNGCLNDAMFDPKLDALYVIARNQILVDYKLLYDSTIQHSALFREHVHNILMLASELHPQPIQSATQKEVDSCLKEMRTQIEGIQNSSGRIVESNSRLLSLVKKVYVEDSERVYKEIKKKYMQAGAVTLLGSALTLIAGELLFPVPIVLLGGTFSWAVYRSRMSAQEKSKVEEECLKIYTSIARTKILIDVFPSMWRNVIAPINRALILQDSLAELNAAGPTVYAQFSHNMIQGIQNISILEKTLDCFVEDLRKSQRH